MTRRILYTILATGLIGMAAILLIHTYISKVAKEQSYSELSEVPAKRTALVLGTSKYLTNGRINLYYKYRIDAVVALYKQGKVKFILISGDNGTRQYNEPISMKNDLIAAGIPEEVIFLDYAGFRTLDSIVRCLKVFGQKDVIIVSQQFHNERALYLANHFGLNAIAFNAKDVSTQYGFKTQVRERLARVKMMIDLVIGKQPKFLGEKVEIK